MVTSRKPLFTRSVEYRSSGGEFMVQRGRKKESDLRNERVTVQVTTREKDKLRGLAQEEGLDISDYIRLKCIYIPFNNLVERR